MVVTSGLNHDMASSALYYHSISENGMFDIATRIMGLVYRWFHPLIVAVNRFTLGGVQTRIQDFTHFRHFLNWI
jgi:hypothetical protein